jgi:hypothetical protein
MQALEDAIPSRIVFECTAMKDFVWTAKMDRLRYLAVRGVPVHVDALTPLIRSLHVENGFATDVVVNGNCVVDFVKIAEAMPHLTVLVAMANENIFENAYRGLAKMTSLTVLDLDVSSFIGSGVLNMRHMKKLRVVHFETEENCEGIVLPQTVETFADVGYESSILDDTFPEDTRLYALALNDNWVDYSRNATWWDRVWKTVHVGFVVLGDTLTVAGESVCEKTKRAKIAREAMLTKDEDKGEGKRVVNSTIPRRMLPEGPPMTLYVFAPCEVRLDDAIKELDVFANRASAILVFREFTETDHQKTRTEGDGTFDTDDLMLEAIRNVCPGIPVTMLTTQTVDHAEVWKAVREYMKPPSVSAEHWNSVCYR